MINTIFSGSMFSDPIWDVVLFGNDLRGYLIFLVILVVLLIILKIISTFVLRHLRRLATRTETTWDDTFIEIISTLKPPFYFFIALYLSLQFLTLGSFVEKLADIILIIWVVSQVIIAVQIFIDHLFKKRFAAEKEEHAASAISIASTIIKVMLWLFGILLILSKQHDIPYRV